MHQIATNATSARRLRAPERKYYVSSAPRSLTSDCVLSTLLCVSVTLGFVFASEACWHWCVLPILGCGIVIGVDFVAWLRGSLDTFDVKGVIGAFGFHYFFLSVLLFVAIGEGIPFVDDNPQDYRATTGQWASLNLAGLIIYQILSSYISRRRITFRTTWTYSHSHFTTVVVTGIAVTCACTAILYILKGGIRAAFIARSSGNVFYEFNALLAPGLATGILLFVFLGSSHFARKRPSTFILLLALPAVVFVQVALAGERGSRGTLIFPLFWGLVLFHYLWFRLRATYILLLVIPLVFFGWLYMCYKMLKLDAVTALQRGASVAQVADRAHVSLLGVIQGDGSRVAIQNYVFYYEMQHPERYDYWHGKTYLYAPLIVIPRVLYPAKPINGGKLQASTQFLKGRGDYAYARHRAYHAYGIAGEAMLNFGPLGIVPAYAIWGVLVGYMRRFCNSIEIGDLRILIVPILIWWGHQLLLWDSDNFVAHTILRAVTAIAVIRVAALVRPNHARRRTLIGKPTMTFPNTGSLAAGT